MITYFDILPLTMEVDFQDTLWGTPSSSGILSERLAIFFIKLHHRYVASTVFNSDHEASNFMEPSKKFHFDLSNYQHGFNLHSNYMGSQTLVCKLTAKLEQTSSRCDYFK